jgi:predicted transcriptional regulator
MKKHLDIHQQGIDIFLPPLEKAILRVMWGMQAHKYHVTIRKVYNVLCQEYKTQHGTPPAYTTILATMTRMSTTGLLHKHNQGTEGYTYSCVYDNEMQFINARVFDVIKCMLTNFAGASGTALSKLVKRERS